MREFIRRIDRALNRLTELLSDPDLDADSRRKFDGFFTELADLQKSVSPQRKTLPIPLREQVDQVAKIEPQIGIDPKSRP
jgi:hypothetical protein